MDQANNYYDWRQVPPGQYTRKQLLKRCRRLNKNVEAVGAITCVFDNPDRIGFWGGMACMNIGTDNE